MQFFLIEPEVAGALAERTIVDRSVHPPSVTRLHYEFDGWLGDMIIESFPAFIVAETVQAALLDMAASGTAFGDAEITVSHRFRELHQELQLPRFVWLKPGGVAGLDDVGVASDGRLVVSSRVLTALRTLGCSNAVIEAFKEP